MFDYNEIGVIFDSRGVAYSKDMKTLYSYPKDRLDESYTIPASVTKIMPGAFEETYVKKIDFEKGSRLREVNAKAFTRAYSLQSIVLPDSVETIDSMAFQFCINLERVNTPKSLSLIRSDAFANCFKLREFKFHDGIKKVMSKAFENCVSLIIDEATISTKMTMAATAFSTKYADRAMKIFQGIEGKHLLKAKSLTPPKPVISKEAPRTQSTSPAKVKGSSEVNNKKARVKDEYICSIVSVNNGDLQKIVKGDDLSPDFSKKLQETIKSVSYESKLPTIPIIVRGVKRPTIEAFAVMTIDKKRGEAAVWDATIRNGLKLYPTTEYVRHPILKSIQQKATQFMGDFNERNPSTPIKVIYIDSEINANKFPGLQKMLLQDSELNPQRSTYPEVSHAGRRYSRFTLAKLDKQDISTR